jgi:hypothetical protein
VPETPWKSPPNEGRFWKSPPNEGRFWKDLPVGLNAVPAPEDGAGDALEEPPTEGRFWKDFTRWAECSPCPRVRCRRRPGRVPPNNGRLWKELPVGLNAVPAPEYHSVPETPWKSPPLIMEGCGRIYPLG